MPETAREEAKARLRELALKAHSRGPWTAEALDDEPTVNWTFDTEGYGPGHGPLAWCNHPEDALYIAAVSPEVVLALLYEVATLRSLSVPETENWEYGIANFGDLTDVVPAQDIEAARGGNQSQYGDYVVRRRPAGRWEPVPVEEEQ